MKTIYNVVIECEALGLSNESPYCLPMQNNLYKSFKSAEKALNQSNKCGYYGWIDKWEIDNDSKVTATRLIDWQGLINDSEDFDLNDKDKEDINKLESLKI